MLPVVVVALILPQPDWSAVPQGAWLAMAYMALLPLSLCYLAWFEALRRLPASLATQGSLLAPVTAVLGAAIFLGEPLGWREVSALVLVLGGVVLAVRA